MMVKYERVRFRDWQMPDYTKGEEIFNMVSHIVGGALGVVALTLCVVFAAIKGDAWGVIGSAIYGASLILLYCMSSIYHGLHHGMGKKVLQVLDHCTIYFLIGGTYTPILFCAIRAESRVWAWVLFGIVWGLAAMAATLTAIDLKKYAKFSMTCYIGMGWCIVLAIKPTLQAVPMNGILWLLFGGISYTVGAVSYGLGKKHRYMHSIFHLFVVTGSVLQYIAILFYVL